MHRHFLFIVAVGMAALPVLAQQDSPQTLDAMRAEIAALQTEMQQMRSERDRSWIDERQKEEVKALIEEVLADAETRGSFQNEAGTLAGWDRGFYLASADDTFRLDIGGLLQFQYLISSADDPPTGDDVERGFVIHRGRLKFSGHVGNPDLNYFIQLESNRSVGDLFLLDAHITYQFTETTALRGGRFVAPLLREQLVGAPNSLGADRSYVNAVFTANRVEGVMLIDTRDDFRLQAAIHDGFRSGQTQGLANDFNADSADVAGTARVDWKLMGDWSEFGDFASFDGDEPSAFLGAAVLGQVGDGSDTTAGDVVIWTVDGSLEMARFNLFAAAVGQHGFDDDATNGGDRYGLLLQGGYMVIPDRFQPFVRAERVWFEDEPDVTILGAGGNWFLRKYAARFTLEALCSLDPITIPSTGLGLIADDGDGQVVGRAQLQLVF